MSTKPVVVWAISCAVLLTLSTAALALRGVAIRFRGGAPKTPDYLVLLAYLCHVAYVEPGLGTGGYGRYMTELLVEEIESSLKGFFISQYFWATGTAAFRLAILLFYMDLFSTVRNFRWPAIGTAVVVFLYWVACLFTTSLLCQPVQSNWDISVPGKCGNVVAIEVFSGAFNMVIDIWVVFLPLPTVWKLQLSSQRKWTLTAAFSLGLCTAAVNLGRLIQTIQCRAEGDSTYCFLSSSILVQGEMCGGVLVATLPLLGPLWKSRRRGTTKPSVPDGTPGARPHGPFQTIGSTPMKGKRSHASDVFTEDSLLRSQNDELGSDWQPQSVPMVLTSPQPAAHGAGNRWTVEVEGRPVHDPHAQWQPR
ncbi:hypothetical protein LA080_005548 [Diaporthe eres]|nr:hypothetical protein LA080_005548 [Diaporthe eres]